MRRDCVLLCTVGGSPQPVLSAINSKKPTFVCFFATGKDPVSGKPGSREQLEGKVIKAKPSATKPTLPNIPAQTGLSQEQWEVREIPSDDLDGAFMVMRRAIGELSERFPDADLVADYTGGTKSMTAALVCAVLESDVTLQLVVGARTNLDRVSDGTEQAVAASIDGVRLERRMAPYLGAWRRFAYREAERGLERITVAVNSPDRPRLQRARSLSRVFALWDDFDHDGAWAALEASPACKGFVASSFPELLPALQRLTHDPADDASVEPARLFDLWLNAERRADQGRFDDAVARWYRLIEWTAQWLIHIKLDANTADLRRELLPPGMEVEPDAKGQIKVGLTKAWQTVAHHVQGPARNFFKHQGPRLIGLLERRSQSILAHGFKPVNEAHWRELACWTESHFLPVFRELALEAGVERDPPQLPTEPPSAILTSQR